MKGIEQDYLFVDSNLNSTLICDKTWLSKLDYRMWIVCIVFSLIVHTVLRIKLVYYNLQKGIQNYMLLFVKLFIRKDSIVHEPLHVA